MSAERLQQSLLRLHETADALETGSATTEPTLGEAPASVAIRALQPAAHLRSMARVVGLTLAQSAATAAVLALLCAVGDPLVPRSERPSLASAGEAVVVAADAHAIPQKHPERP